MFHIVPECSLNKGFNIFNLDKQRAVTRLNSSKLALFMLVVLMVSAVTMPIIMVTVTATTDEADQNTVLIDSLTVIGFQETNEDMRTNKLLEIIETSRYQVVKTYSRIEDEGASIPDASRDKYLEGRSKEEYAVKLRNEGLYEQASWNAIEAMRKYKEAITIAEQAATTPQIHETEIIAEKTIGLSETVAREKNHINRLEVLTVEAEKKGFNVATMRSNVRQAEAILNNGEILLQAGNVEKASRELDTAKNIIDRSMRDLNQVTKIIKAQKAEVYFQQTEKMLHSYEQIIVESHEALTPQEEAAAKESIQDSKIQMEEIKKDLKAGNVDEAIEGFEDVEVLGQIPQDMDAKQFYQQNESGEIEVFNEETSVNGSIVDGEQSTQDSYSNDTSVDEGGVNGEQVPPNNSTDELPADDGVIDGEQSTQDSYSNDTSVDEGGVNGEQVPPNNSTDELPADEDRVDEKQIMLNRYVDEMSTDANVVDEKSVENIFVDKESVKPEIETEKMSVDKQTFNNEYVEKKIRKDNPEQNMPTPDKSKQDRPKQNNPTPDMPIDEKSIDRKTIDKQSIHSDNSINGKLIDKGSSVDRKKPELDESRIIRETKNNGEKSQVDKSQLIQEWRLDIEDNPQHK
jgi:tetratricopeptide (TPR) repeat protein